MKTYYGIFLDLNESTYIADVEDFKFYFSSEKTLKKFLTNIEEYEKSCKSRIRSSMNLEIVESSIFCAFSYYSMLEKRGFKVEFWHNGKPTKTWTEKPKFYIEIFD